MAVDGQSLVVSARASASLLAERQAYSAIEALATAGVPRCEASAMLINSLGCEGSKWVECSSHTAHSHCKAGRMVEAYLIVYIDTFSRTYILHVAVQASVFDTEASWKACCIRVLLHRGNWYRTGTKRMSDRFQTYIYC
jgi:hypothetical protein